MKQEIIVEELLKLKKEKNVQLIDVRSPSEFAEFTIPDSINIPIFEDHERHEIGTLYKQVGTQAAQYRGLELLSAKLPAFIATLEQIPQQKIVFCWRGGMRSKITATLLDLMGISVWRLQGGIRAYRNWVHESLQSEPHVPPCVVLRGYTGTGKTLILRKLAEKGYPVLDLEQMAQHRGSIFGHIRLQPHNQKMFEALLIEKLRTLQDAPYVLMEAESRRIGKVIIPEFLIKKKEQGLSLLLHMPLEERVRLTILDYEPSQHHEACLTAFHQIRKRIHTPIASDISYHLATQNYEQAVSLLLQHYYDPRYHHAGLTYLQSPIDLEVRDVDDAITRVEEVVKNNFPRV